MSPPTHLPSDYIEIGYIALVMLMGIPLNSYVFHQQIKEYLLLSRQAKYDLNTAFLLQKIHLNLANLLILLLHCPTQTGWLITYRWVAGDFMCRFTHFIWMLSFIISSNIVAVIGVDRLRNVLKMEAMWTGRAGGNVAGGQNILLGVAWSEAIVCSFPQVWAWTAVPIFPNWDQCFTVWEKWRLHLALTNANVTEQDVANIEYPTQRVYLAIHLLVIFWLPFLVISGSYFVIIGKLCKFSLTSMTRVPYGAVNDQDTELGTPNAVTVVGSPKSQGRLLNCDTDVSPTSPILESSIKSTIRTTEYSAIRPGHQPSAVQRRAPAVPAWRTQMRSKMFATASLIVSVYILCWLPYNLISLVEFFDPVLAEEMKRHGYWLERAILLNVVVNPFIYGFGHEAMRNAVVKLRNRMC